jgi:hypothetical protein
MTGANLIGDTNSMGDTRTMGDTKTMGDTHRSDISPFQGYYEKQ